MKLNVWHESLPAGQAVETEPPIPEAVRGESLIYDGHEIPLWEIEVETAAELIAIIEREGGEARITTTDNEYPHPELIFP